MRKLIVSLCGWMVVCSLPLVAARPASPSLAAGARVLDSVPAWFEPNQGLLDAKVKYFARGAGYALQLEESGAALSLVDGPASARVRLTLPGSRPRPAIEAADLQPGRTNYLLGNRASAWKSNVPHFGRVQYRDVYAGIDMVYRGSGKQLEYDFVVAPNADPSRIRLKFQGADRIRLDADGSLVLALGDREIRQPKPVIYQETANGRLPVDGGYIVARNGEVRFHLASYDETKPLVIDPVLVYAGYFGGATLDQVTGIANDPDGAVWLTGTTYSVWELPVQNEAYLKERVGGGDAFIAKLRVPSLGAPVLEYFTYLGGTAQEWGGQILVDRHGMVYITGSTLSMDFPVTANAVSSQSGGTTNIPAEAVTSQDVFVAKINPAAPIGADSLVYSTYLGGTGLDVPMAFCFDNDDKLLIAGYTSSDNIQPFLMPAVQPANRGGWEGFLFKIDPVGAVGSTLLYSSYFGGGSTDVISGVAVDAAGGIYLTGYTMSDDFPIAGDLYQATLSGPSDLFVVKFDLTKTGLDALVYCTYLGGTGTDIAQAMQMDANGSLWLTGYTLSPDFPVTASAYNPAFKSGVTDAFLIRLDPARPPAEFIGYSTFLGGSGTDIAYSLAVLGNGKIALTGYTLSNDFPVIGAPATGVTRKLMADAFVSVFDTAVPGVGGLVFSTYFGGVNQDVGVKVIPDAAGNLYVAGTTLSRNLPVTDGSTKLSPFTSPASFLLRFDKQPGE